MFVVFGLIAPQRLDTGRRGTMTPSPDNNAVDLARVGPTHEWHLVLPTPFSHLTFGLVPRLHEPVVRLGPALPAPRLIAVGAIRHAVAGDRLEQLLVDHPAECSVFFAPQGKHRLE